MKNFLFATILSIGLLHLSTARAQVKIGYISIDNMVGLMPEALKIDSILARYQTDSLNPKYTEIVSMYQYKDSLYRDSLKTPPAVRKQIALELPNLIYQIQNWQQISNQAIENKQNDLLRPIYAKVYEAIKQVGKEKGYTHILNKEAFLMAPEGDDIILLVAAKLKVSIPKSTPITK